MEHFTCSIANRAINCPGSLQLTPRVNLLREDNDTKLEGKTADWVIAQLADDKPVAVGTMGPYGKSVTDDMLDHVLGYFQHILQVLFEEAVIDAPDPSINPNHIPTVLFESDLDLGWMTAPFTDIPGITGRCDVRFHRGTARKLLVWDFKYGHRPVEAENNEQLMGACLDESIRRYTDSARLFIYQPRSMDGIGPVKEWVVNADDIMVWQERYTNARLLSVKPDAPLCTGEHCRDCRGCGICPALMEDIELAKTVLDAPASATPEEVGERLQLAKQLNEQSGYLKDNLTAQGLHMVLKDGKTVPGFKVVRGRTQRRVSDAETIIAVAPLYGVDIEAVTKRTTRSLKELEKALGSDLIDEFTVKPEGKLELVSESDKRQPAINNNAEQVFSAPINMPGA